MDVPGLEKKITSSEMDAHTQGNFIYIYILNNKQRRRGSSIFYCMLVVLSLPEGQLIGALSALLGL